MGVVVVPMTIAEANEFVSAHHRHNKPVTGGRYALGASFEGVLIGVAIVGRPVSRHMQDGFTAEVLRCCTDGVARTLSNGHTLPACSRLYRAAWEAWQAMGGRRMITYTLASERGSSLKASGWRIVGEVQPAREGAGWCNRPGREWQPVLGQAKFRWERAA